MSQENKLKKLVDDIHTDIDKDKVIKETLRLRDRERTAFMKLPTYDAKMGFFCDHCVVDFVVPAYKVWSEIHQIGTWRSFCPICEGLVYRHITQKKADPYYFRSEKMLEMRSAGAKDMLQPGQYGFKTNYGDAFEHYYKKYEEQQEVLFGKYASMGLVGKSLSQKNEEEDLKAQFN